MTYLHVTIRQREWKDSIPRIYQICWHNDRGHCIEIIDMVAGPGNRATVYRALADLWTTGIFPATTDATRALIDAMEE